MKKLALTLAALAMCAAPALAQSAPGSDGNGQAAGNGPGAGGGPLRERIREARQARMQGQGPGAQGGGGRMMEQIMQLPSLNEKQKEDIKAIFAKQRETNAPQWQQMRQLREQIRSASEGDRPPLIQQMKSLRQQMKQSREQTISNVESLLTPAQKTQWKSMREQQQQGGDGEMGGPEKTAN